MDDDQKRADLFPRLSLDQNAQLLRWLPDARLRAELSWNLTDTVVLDVTSILGRFIVKAAGPANTHIGREITAHQGATACLIDSGRAARMIQHDRAANILVTDYLEGTLVMGSGSEFDADIHHQAGALLRTFHDQAERCDDDAEARATTKALAWLDQSHRIDPSTVAAVRRILTTYRPRPVTVVPTHGDWSPRNWLVDHRIVKIIDFGRFDFRPALSDFCRLAARHWRTHPDLEHAFLDGYGTDPRDPELWAIFTLREAIGTAVWAYQVGDEPFENEGHRMLTDAVTLF
ncbi:phosphotransferase family protein [Rhodococcus gordoniae]|uniref:phosphotransferase family protein n=1 Tax=Rhodococcus gordoniae TaxID=223392 RepID=UPI0007CD8AF0|nr:phosphotransferase [Rhodococcus gordoniae]